MSSKGNHFEDLFRDVSFDDVPDYNHRDNLEKELITALSKPQSRPGKVWRIIMKNNVSKLAVVIIIVAVLSFFAFEKLSSPAWAIEQAVDALKDFRAVHIVGALPNSNAEIWMRANEAETQSTDIVIRQTNGAVVWVKDGSTYDYEPSQNTVFFEPAVTAGASPWFGPVLIERLGKANGSELKRSKDSVSGQDICTLYSSITDVKGPQSFIIEFDVETSLPISLKQWKTIDRSGPPAFQAFEIKYYKELEDSLFDVRIPGNPTYVEKPLTIPDKNIGLLINPDDGISTEGLTQQQACEKILGANYKAVIEGNLAELKKLCPISQNWSDEFIRSVIFRTGQNDQIVELVKIGQICKTGQSKIGPIVAVPAVVKLKDGQKLEDKMIIQFRRTGSQSSCVVYGPYGLSREIK
jgi:hypothetical protein